MLHLEAVFCGKTSPRESSVTLARKQVSKVLGGSCQHQVSRAVQRSDQKGTQGLTQTQWSAHERLLFVGVPVSEPSRICLIATGTG